MTDNDAMLIPADKLSNDALSSIIKEFVLREGTDYGATTYSLEQKIEQIMTQIKQNKAAIVFDAETETCNVVPVSSL